MIKNLKDINNFNNNQDNNYNYNLISNHKSQSNKK